MYRIEQLSPYLQKYNTVTGTTNLEVCARSMLAGIQDFSKLALDGDIKTLLFIGGKNKQRSPLRDSSVTEIVIPKSFDDEEIYIESIISVINRYLAGLPKLVGNDNKIKSILIKLLSNNVVGFYNKLNLPKSYQDTLNLIFSALIKASNECIARFQDAIENKEYLMPKLPKRFEYQPLKPAELYKEYFSWFSNEGKSETKDTIDKFMEQISLIEVDEDDSDIDVGEETEADFLLSTDALIDRIPEIISNFGYQKVLAIRTDKFIDSKFIKLDDEKVKRQLYKIIADFKGVYIRLTSKVWDDTFKRMFDIAPTTYKENKSKVIREIADISNSEEFSQFKKLLLE